MPSATRRHRRIVHPQVWNKQRRHEILIDVDDVALGHETKMRWNDTCDWVWSRETLHEPILSVEGFDAAQAMFTATNGPLAARPPKAGTTSCPSSCAAACATGGCRASGTTAAPTIAAASGTTTPVEETEHPKSVYVKEEAILPGLDRWLATLFDDDHVDDTCDKLAGSAEPDTAADKREADLRKQIADCDRRLERYRNVLDEGGDVATVAKWIAEVERERKTLTAQLGQAVPGGKLTRHQLKALITAVRDIVGVLADADPADKANLYEELGITLTYGRDGTHQAALVALGDGAERDLRIIEALDT